MCGIVGAVAQRNIVPVLVEGLKRLEYRGYDSCGVAVLVDGKPQRARSVARVADLEQQVQETHLSGVSGIAHTRWATHGAPVTDNAHPIFSRDALALVHNGIIENYETLREMLRGKGYTFVSQTDTEVIAHLIHSLYRGDLFATVREAVQQLHGAYAIAVLHKDQPHTVVGARQGSPLVVGLGENENFLASDALALAGSTERFIFLEEGDVCELTLEQVRIADRNGNEVPREVRQVAAYGGAVELGPYRHFMQKEIFEQPRAITDTIPPADAYDASLFGAGAAEVFAGIDSLLILACGTSYYAGLTAKYWLESIAKIPTQVEIASEYRYRESVPNPNALVVVISQSGETADTLAALKHAQTLGHRHTLAVCNVGSSAMVRQTELAFLTHAGLEIGVASTKAFTTQLVALFVLAMTLGKLRGHVSAEQEAEHIRQLRHLPAALNSVLALEPQIIAWAEEFSRKEHALFLGRGLHYPIALEGALKLKEISYIHAEAYPAGELKHGPLALVTEAMPVVTIAPNDALLEKLKSNIQEVRARGGQLYVFADSDTRIVNDEGLHVIRMPEHYGPLSPILHVVPLQLLAYHTACARGTDVDKPRNLAKSVTVE
ncbi:glutamine--fructose-6-phosphate transaminase (isomerizing) [Paraburkholderia bonniea]|uniref:glutamine--fructose-6-phosphate transaminase (isomerizing) n=1 Tax=Paraburkholderia bonniea TaxID=2152891 RepID=UPI001290DA4D|nr:glutamine--fructose-6-phosphate transaminase (isomerizing) [Paraburkholderia bonniea]WJF90505.1 glutamine--fructose-6-phosphate transaminase (isomerizing) [Paraburkholderia bonniea]WJF93820.1 glutamine--fructose-6-phosphate transaminase (isomerizing) [Paraburkholderia bonniea]